MKMAMKWVHALAVALTVLLFVVRSRVCAGLVPSKRRSIFCPVCCDHLRSTLATPSSHNCCCERVGRACGAAWPPRCKRDPDILVDNEDLLNDPHVQ